MLVVVVVVAGAGAGTDAGARFRTLDIQSLCQSVHLRAHSTVDLRLYCSTFPSTGISGIFHPTKCKFTTADLTKLFSERSYGTLVGDRKPG